MSKSITIKEGGQDKTLTVDKLRTALSGVCVRFGDRAILPEQWNRNIYLYGFRHFI